jgi:uncharacterized protein (TIRG00374 family)
VIVVEVSERDGESWRWRRIGVRLLGPALLVVVLLRSRESGAVLQTLSAVSLAPLLAALALNGAIFYLKIGRWDLLLRQRGIHYPRRRMWGAVLASQLVSLITPGRLGDALRAHYLRHDIGTPYALGLASVVMDRVCDLYVLVGFMALGVLRLGPALAGRVGLVAWGVVTVTVLAPLVLFIPGIAERFARIAYTRFLKKSDAAGFDVFLASLRSYVGRHLGLPLLLTAGAFVVNYVQGWLIARALHLDLSLFDVASLMAVASLLGLLPLSPSGVGIRELFFSAAFPLLGYAAAAGISFGLVISFVLYASPVIPGLVAWQLAPPRWPAERSAPGSTGTRS